MLLTASLAQGGAELVVTQLALATRAAAWDVTVVSMMPPEAFVKDLRQSGVNVVSLGMKPGRLNLRGLWRFLTYIRRFRPDVVHAHMYHASILARLARVLTGIPAICTIHSEVECAEGRTAAPIREWIYRMTDFACSRTTAVSESVRQRFVQKKVMSSSRIAVIANGVDMQRFQPCNKQRLRTRHELGWQNTFVWLAVGRLVLAKDYPTLIEAFKKLKTSTDSARLVIAGEGRLRPQIQNIIDQAGMQESVTLLGSRSDIPALMNACDALVMCSAWEGGPLVLLEAGAMGRPVVATEVGAAPQIVVPGRTGLIVPTRDPAALAKAMSNIMALEPGQLERMGCQARRHVGQHFSISEVHKRYLNMYEEVLGVSS